MYKRIKVRILGRENRPTPTQGVKTTTRRELPRLRDPTTLTADRSVDDIFEITDGRDAEEDNHRPV